MRKRRVKFSFLLASLVFCCLSQIAQAASFTANASLDWSTFQVQLFPVSGNPTLTWFTLSQADTTFAYAGSLSRNDYAGDWTSDVSVDAVSGSTSANSAISANGLASSLSSSGRLLAISTVSRFGNFAISGGDALVLMTVGVTTSIHLGASVAASNFISGNASLNMTGYQPFDGSGVSGDIRTAADSIISTDGGYPQFSNSSGVLKVSMYFADGMTGKLEATTHVGLTQSVFPTPIPMPLDLMIGALAGLVAFCRRGRSRSAGT